MLLSEFLQESSKHCMKYFGYVNAGMKDGQCLTFDASRTGDYTLNTDLNGWKSETQNYTQKIIVPICTSWHAFYCSDNDKVYAVADEISKLTSLTLDGNIGMKNAKAILEECTKFFGGNNAEGTVFSRDLYKCMPKLLQTRIKNLIREEVSFNGGIWGYDSELFILWKDGTDYEKDEWGSYGNLVRFEEFIPVGPCGGTLSKRAYMLPIAELSPEIRIIEPVINTGATPKTAIVIR